MAKASEIREYAQANGCSDAIALKVLTLQKQKARLVEALRLATQYAATAPHGEKYGIRTLRLEEAESMRALLRELGEL